MCPSFDSVFQRGMYRLHIFNPYLLSLGCLPFSPTWDASFSSYLLSSALHLHGYAGKPLAGLLLPQVPQEKFDISARDAISWCSESYTSSGPMTLLFRGVGLVPTPVCITPCILGTKAALTHHEPTRRLLHCNPCLQRAHTGCGVGSRGQAKLLPQPLQVCPLYFLQNVWCTLPVGGPVSMGH